MFVLATFSKFKHRYAKQMYYNLLIFFVVKRLTEFKRVTLYDSVC